MINIKGKCLRLIAGSVAILLSSGVGARADLIFTGTGTGVNGITDHLAAKADFSLVGSTLSLTLTNTSAAATPAQGDILTALFFNLNSGTLTPLSSSIAPGSTAIGNPNNYLPGQGTVYATGLSEYSMNSGVSASGLNVFSNSGWFTLPGEPPVDGSNFGIVSAATTHLTPGGQGPNFADAVILNWTVSSGFTLADISSSAVEFQFGTDLTEPHFSGTPPTGGPPPTPEPSTALLLGFGIVGLGLKARRSRRA